LGTGGLDGQAVCRALRCPWQCIACGPPWVTMLMASIIDRKWQQGCGGEQGITVLNAMIQC